MEYTIYRLTFQGPVHFGIHTLEDGDCTCHADTIFSALFKEAVKLGEEKMKALYHAAKDGQLLLSDAFPYTGTVYYLPKPMKRIELGDGKGDSVIKKAYKKLKYIPMDQLPVYLEGKYDVLRAGNGDRERGCFEMKTSACVRGGDEAVPYRIGTYTFYPDSGLYVIMGYQNEKVKKLAEELWKSLSFSGIGGRRSSGMGRFALESDRLPEEFAGRLESKGSCYMSLSVSLPADAELEGVLEDASYQLCRRSGFVASETYALEQMRKRDLYVFSAGSCFARRYEGDVYDVSGGQGGHAVYRYAKPMLVEVDL